MLIDMRNHLLEVVLVDDDPAEIKTVTRALQNLHIAHDLSVYRSGLDALLSLRRQRKHLRRSYPFFLLLDLRLPDMPGVQFLRELRQDPYLRAAIVFVLADSDTQEDKLAAYECQVAGYLIRANLGNDYGRLTALVQAYYHAVEFPSS
jgi:CheY-like chemotaxis protein